VTVRITMSPSQAARHPEANRNPHKKGSSDDQDWHAMRVRH